MHKFKNIIPEIPEGLLRTLVDLKRRFSSKISTLVLLNSGLILFQTIYLKLRYQFINLKVPFWYTKPWGDLQLAPKSNLFLLPFLSLLILIIGIVLFVFLKRFYIRYGMDIVTIVITFVNVLITISLVRIIFSASSPFPYIIKPLYLSVLVPGIIAFFTSYLVLPRFIDFAHGKALITNPKLHDHPGMLLQQPTTRGGGFVYGTLFVILGLIFSGLALNLIPFFFAVLLLSLLGIADDFQNTNARSGLKFIESPIIRLLFMIPIVSIIYVSGISIGSFTVPFGSGVLELGSKYIAWGFTTIWIIWILNLLSWSNGVDGQYGGIVGIASLLICFLALRFDQIEPMHRIVAALAAISAGLSFGFTKYTWYPSKIMWGFGAISAGLVLATLSILSSSKIITSVLIILLPFLDASVTALRRILQGHSPLRGDKGHLHHILLNRGWSVPKIALFYWGTTALFGILGLVTADTFTVQVGMILVGIVAFTIVLLNLRSKKGSSQPQSIV
ncbi:glycosyltransferase family 4 protein [Patescibacteria group bacterium]